MCTGDESALWLEMEGEIVQILEEGERRRVKLALGPWAVLELPPEAARDLHLGDRLVLRGTMSEITRPGGGDLRGDVPAHPADRGAAVERRHP